MHTHVENLKIEVITETDLRWKNIYEESSTAHFFQSPQWAVLFSHFKTMKSFHVCITYNSSTVIIPGIVSRRLGGLFKSYLSLPLGTFGGFLSKTPVPETVISFFLSYLKKHKFHKINIFCNDKQVEMILEKLGTITQLSSLSLNLDRPYAEIERDLFSKNKRKLVNRGKRRGVVISKEKSETIINAYFVLQKKVEKEKGWATTFSESYIREMLLLEEADLWTAWIDSRLACAIVSFAAHRFCTAWLGILDRGLEDALSTQPMNYLYASMIEHYQNKRFIHFDMGHSLGISSLEQFKRGFGCIDTPLTYYIWKSPSLRTIDRIRSFSIRK
jgi:hypothetical protein